MWAQTVCQGYQQTTLLYKELNDLLSVSAWSIYSVKLKDFIVHVQVLVSEHGVIIIMKNRKDPKSFGQIVLSKTETVQTQIRLLLEEQSDLGSSLFAIQFCII